MGVVDLSYPRNGTVALTPRAGLWQLPYKSYYLFVIFVIRQPNKLSVVWTRRNRRKAVKVFIVYTKIMFTLKENDVAFISVIFSLAL
jgi:hypothetical protein